MVKYEEKFIVINKKHLKDVPKELMENFTTALTEIREHLPDHKYYTCNQDEDYAPDVLKLILFDEMKKQMESTPRKEFNIDEMRHLAVNYAINCVKGYEGSFDEWYNTVSPDWRHIANEKH